MSAPWGADPAAGFRRRIGKSAHELGTTSGNASCPDIWELDNGDFAVIGTQLRDAYRDRLTAGVTIDEHESVVVIPRSMLIAAKADIPDA
ncbi:hypothetical protein ACIA8K_23655 [Catenuloplanes sp. NPDC051500]|uniref:hypothetical protein n=1 Tax=Catenuloplanes sp. NPDC051500 TaxID=3363959 RepID=UPI0037A2BE99